jgi:hypothetical protein
MKCARGFNNNNDHLSDGRKRRGEDLSDVGLVHVVEVVALVVCFSPVWGNFGERERRKRRRRGEGKRKERERRGEERDIST